MKIDMVAPSTLKTAKYNPRQISEVQLAQLCESIKTYGFVDPIIVNKNNNIVVGGHQRLKAAQTLGFDKVPVVWVDLDLRQEKALNIALNKISGDWDADKLNDLVLDLAKEGYDNDDFFGAGFTADEMNIFDLGDVKTEALKPAADPDDAPSLPLKPKTVLGDLYKIGNHYLVCGDSRDYSVVEKLCGGRQIDLLLTDPPYNVAYKGKTKDALEIQNDEMGDDNFFALLLDAAKNAFASMKDGASFYIFHADSEGLNFRKSTLDAGFLLKQCLIWLKNQMVLGRQDYQWQHEPCLYGWKPGASHKWFADRKQTTILKFDKPQRNGEHPTMKPIALIKYLIKNSSEVGDAVLDLFGGAGTTMVACEAMGRVNYSVELDPKYCDVIVQRMRNTYPGLEIRLNGAVLD